MKKETPKVKRKRTAQADHTFELLMQRFDTVDKDNDEIKKTVAAHVEAITKKHTDLNKVVEKHSTYWGLLLKVTGVVGAAFTVWLFK